MDTTTILIHKRKCKKLKFPPPQTMSAELVCLVQLYARAVPTAPKLYVRTYAGTFADNAARPCLYVEIINIWSRRTVFRTQYERAYVGIHSCVNPVDSVHSACKRTKDIKSVQDIYGTQKVHHVSISEYIRDQCCTEITLRSDETAEACYYDWGINCTIQIDRNMFMQILEAVIEYVNAPH
jgi:hypothetical protein